MNVSLRNLAPNKDERHVFANERKKNFRDQDKKIQSLIPQSPEESPTSSTQDRHGTKRKYTEISPGSQAKCRPDEMKTQSVNLDSKNAPTESNKRLKVDREQRVKEEADSRSRRQENRVRFSSKSERTLIRHETPSDRQQSRRITTHFFPWLESNIFG